jgi:hypothetical protein
MNKQKLLEAADWAEKNIEPIMFDMSDYRTGDEKKTECNSVGCMVGHLTAIDSKNVMENYLNRYRDIKFGEWSINYFALDEDEWDYLFSADWAYSDNTLEGAITRMRRLANGMTEEEIAEELNAVSYGF